MGSHIGESDEAIATSSQSGGAIAAHAPWRGERVRSSAPLPRSEPPVTPQGARLPLEGLRVANFGWAWAGPAAGQVLGLLGAEVYKIETRARIDINRTLPR